LISSTLKKIFKKKQEEGMSFWTDLTGWYIDILVFARPGIYIALEYLSIYFFAATIDTHTPIAPYLSPLFSRSDENGEYNNLEEEERC
jgi:hypothetical protein